MLEEPMQGNTRLPVIRNLFIAPTEDHLRHSFHLEPLARSALQRFRRAGDLHQLLDHVVQELSFPCVSGPVVYLLAFPAAGDESAGLQLPQMVGYGRAAHIHEGGEVDHALFAVAQKPEDADAAAVAQLLENIRHRLEFACFGHVFQDGLFDDLPMVVGQLLVRHGEPSFLRWQRETGPVLSAVFSILARNRGEGNGIAAALE